MCIRLNVNWLVRIRVTIKTRVMLVRGKIRMSKKIKCRIYVSKDWSSSFLFCHQVSVGWGTPPGQSRSCSWTSKLCLKMKIVLWRMPLVQWSLWAGPLPPLNDNGLRNGGDSKANIVRWISSFHDHRDSHYLCESSSVGWPI